VNAAILAAVDDLPRQSNDREQNVEISLINFWAGHFLDCNPVTVLPVREVHIPSLAVSVICLDSLAVNERMAVFYSLANEDAWAVADGCTADALDSKVGR
jgi:hypothetical protein